MKTSHASFSSAIEIHTEVAHALKEGAPLVALETSVVAHGLPAPHNIEAYLACEKAVRETGAIPVTVGVLGGRLVAGMCQEEIGALVEQNPMKLGCGDIGCAIALGASGGTTVSATVAIASRLGIRMVATGGIGGVHRGASETFDISADLNEISCQQVAVVCSGAKTILDIGKTLERLETLGVPVLGYQTKQFPGFYIGDSGYPLQWSVENAMEAGKVLYSHWDIMHHRSGVVIAQGPPKQLDPIALEQTIGQACEEALAQNIRGKPLSPFLLSRLASLSEGESVRVNLLLLEANAGIAAKIAVAMAQRGKI